MPELLDVLAISLIPGREQEESQKGNVADAEDHFLGWIHVCRFRRPRRYDTILPRTHTLASVPLVTIESRH